MSHHFDVFQFLTLYNILYIERERVREIFCSLFDSVHESPNISRLQGFSQSSGSVPGCSPDRWLGRHRLATVAPRSHGRPCILLERGIILLQRVFLFQNEEVFWRIRLSSYSRIKRSPHARIRRFPYSRIRRSSYSRNNKEHSASCSSWDD